MILANRFKADGHFTRLYAKIREEGGAFTVSVRLQNHLRPGEAAWGEKIACSLENASSMIGLLAAEFCITSEFISIDICMADVRAGTLH